MGSQGQEENFHDASGTGGDEVTEFTGSDVVDRNTRVISQNLLRFCKTQMPLNGILAQFY